ncbi:hypothetical protein JAO73_22360 [Hymenobacter sp. BT523]|uniref:DUF6371 domain-containing protein n=1 Tax=Hymenobacter sp. BT523 TaxID=2795725 RepID=UPI0018ED9B81|nr:DUF6371 domain-containing protein [Hymenobacter sp. BT523]MBJ6111780.1 hypothetical protein [Hymenobacter sp. BT523]
MPVSSLPYLLQQYAGPRSRTACPACGTPRSFTRYFIAATGELLPEAFGRCDREVKCGFHLSPYARPSEGGPSYAASLKRGNTFKTAKPIGFRRRLPPLSPLTIPQDVYRASLCHYERNALVQLLRKRFGEVAVADLLARFPLGTSSYWPGACVFWLIDKQGRVRGGQVVLYDDTGHTVKHPHRHTSWVHPALVRAHQKRGEALPDWLQEYARNGAKSPCLYGLPQLNMELLSKPVALVESAKTAMLATLHFPMFVWLATMGLSYLTAERLEPLQGRRVVLFPDAGAFDKWNHKAEGLRRLGFDITVSDGLEKLATPAEREAGLDLADIILRQAPALEHADNELSP